MSNSSRTLTNKQLKIRKFSTERLYRYSRMIRTIFPHKTDWSIDSFIIIIKLIVKISLQRCFHILYKNCKAMSSSPQTKSTSWIVPMVILTTQRSHIVSFQHGDESHINNLCNIDLSHKIHAYTIGTDFHTRCMVVDVCRCVRAI